MRKMSDLVRGQNPLILPSSASVLEAARKSRRENSRLGRIAVLIQISRLIDCRLIQRI
jgi:hypothetical protein